MKQEIENMFTAARLVEKLQYAKMQYAGYWITKLEM